MEDDVIPLNEIGKIEIVKVYNQAYVDKLEKENERLKNRNAELEETIDKLQVQNNWLEGCKLELAEHLGKANDRISELEQQIEKMKVCQNCKHFDFSEPNYCYKGVYREKQYICSKWEIKENDI